MKTIGVKDDTLKKVKSLSKKYGYTNGEFVELSARFFSKNSINPKDDYSIKAEIIENNKRLNQVIAFIRQQEKAFIVPIFGEIRELVSKLKDYLNILQPRMIVEKLQRVSESNKQLTYKIEEQQSQIKKQLLWIEQTAKQNEALGKRLDLLIQFTAIDSQKFEDKKRKEKREELAYFLQNAR